MLLQDGVLFRDARLATLKAEYDDAERVYAKENRVLAQKVVDTVGTFTPVVAQARTAATPDSGARDRVPCAGTLLTWARRPPEHLSSHGRGVLLSATSLRD